MTLTGAPEAVTLTGWHEVQDGLRCKALRQALYDEGAVVMADCLLDLHGDEHRARRRVENRLFRRELFRTWELGALAGTISSTLAPAIADGRADLVAIGYRITMNLTALVAGLDRPAGTSAETDQLLGIVRTLSEGATLVHSTRDHDEVRAEVRRALAELDEAFLVPSRARREALLARVAAGELDEADLPTDVLTVLLRNQGDLQLPPEVVRREVAFYLQAGSHSTANACTHTFDELVAWADRSSVAAALVARARAGQLTLDDRLTLQRCVHEALRLYPASPVAWRRAVDPAEILGRSVGAEQLVVLDLARANRDPDVWGGAADVFDPMRTPPSGVPPWGHSFGGGAHACIGAELDGGTAAVDVADGEQHLFGTVALMVEALLAAGARPDPRRAAELDPTSTRRHFSSYPVVLDPPGGREGER